ncbi:MAG TPA: hypothetical protein VGO00_06360 [Kofleriaceae bacterium]|nr:hypothetical protein [Kofleriaceae bacterium]
MSDLLFEQFPVPFVGAWDAPVVMLTLNPGGRSDPRLYTDDYREQCRKRLRFETRVPFMSLDAEFAGMHGARYWRARLSRILDRAQESTLAWGTAVAHVGGRDWGARE